MLIIKGRAGLPRRARVGRVATAVCALAAAAIVAAPASALASDFPPPPSGFAYEVPQDCYALNVPLQINTGIVNLDFKGGIRVRVETSSAESIRLPRPVVDGCQDGASPGRAAARAASGGELAPSYSYEVFGSALLNDGRQVDFVGAQPMMLMDPDLPTHATEGSYRLAAPVDLVAIDDPGRVVGHIDAFPAHLTSN